MNPVKDTVAVKKILYIKYNFNSNGIYIRFSNKGEKLANTITGEDVFVLNRNI